MRSAAPQDEPRRKWDRAYVQRRKSDIAKRARMRSLRKHGATGVTPDIDPQEAPRQGFCMECHGVFPRLYKHVPIHMSVAEYREKWKIPQGVPLLADSERERQSQAARGL